MFGTGNSPGGRHCGAGPLVAAALAWAAFSHSAMAFDPSGRDFGASRIAAALEQALLSPVVTVEGVALPVVDLRELYTGRGYQPVWVLDPGGRRRALEIAEVLSEAERDGLDPADYFHWAIAAALDGNGLAERVGADLLMTTAVLNYAGDVGSGRIDPGTVSRNFDYVWEAFDRHDVLANLAAADDADEVRAIMAGYAPQDPVYRSIRGALVQARAEFANADWPDVDPGPTLRPGERAAMVPSLRARLAASGHTRVAAPVAATAAEDGDELLYTPDLVAAVERFQAESGLHVDGIVGPNTQAELAASPQDRINQIIASLERWRWLPELSQRYVLVNIPEYRLRAVEGTEVVRDMNVIVGHRDRTTPLFSSAFQWVVWNPTWSVPHSILQRDIMPRLAEDPTYLSTRGFAADGASLVQRPGPDNALGKVKFLMPNNFSVYLHDTPSRDLFHRQRRTLSSGCVRVEDPVWLAEFILEHNIEWDDRVRDRVMSNWQTRRFDVRRQTQVHLAYITARMEEDGDVSYIADVYGLDGRTMTALERRTTSRWQSIRNDALVTARIAGG